MINNIQQILQRFSEAKSLFANQKFIYTEIDEYAFSFRTKTSTSDKIKKLLLVAAVHGNEVGGIEALIHFSQIFSETAVDNIEITLALGNVPAVKAMKRFVDFDLNRSFSKSNESTVENSLAQRLKKLIQNVDVIIDLHQTIQPSESSFLIFPYSKNVLHFAEIISGENCIITYQGNFSSEGSTLGAYAHSIGKQSVTFEMGEIGVCSHQIKESELLLNKAVKFLSSGEQIINKNIKYYTFSDLVIKASEGLKLVTGLRNFTKISQGQKLAEHMSGALYADRDFFVLFPKYGEYAIVGNDLCRALVIVEKEQILKW